MPSGTRVKENIMKAYEIMNGDCGLDIKSYAGCFEISTVDTSDYGFETIIFGAATNKYNKIHSNRADALIYHGKMIKKFEKEA